MRGVRRIAVSLGVSMLASVGLVIVYISGGQNQLEGLLLGLALGGMGFGITLWATDLLIEPEKVEERASLESSEGDRKDAVEMSEEGQFTRRTLLTRMLGGAGATLAAALAIPALSLGPRPGQDLFKTKWTPGARVVDENGRFIRPGDISVEEIVTVFPENYVGSGDSQAVLVKVDSDLLQVAEGREDWVPQGCLAYSKICTHAGCPVGLYRSEDHQLLCPCHQSTFDVLEGGQAVFGPAIRALPQLPLEVDADGYLVAQSDFPEPVGPSFWNRTREA